MICRGVVRGVNTASWNYDICEANIAVTSHCTYIPKLWTTIKSEAILDMERCDVCDPMNFNSIHGSRYFVTIIDDHSNWIDPYPIRRKCESVQCYLWFQKFSEREAARKIILLRPSLPGVENVCWARWIIISTAMESNMNFMTHVSIKMDLMKAWTVHFRKSCERC